MNNQAEMFYDPCMGLYFKVFLARNTELSK